MKKVRFSQTSSSINSCTELSKPQFFLYRLNLLREMTNFKTGRTKEPLVSTFVYFRGYSR